MHQSDKEFETEVCSLKLHDLLESYQLLSISGQSMCPLLLTNNFKH